MKLKKSECGDVQWIHVTQTGSSERGNKTPGSVKGEELLNYVSEF
jgi:hypothetical protein